MNLDGTHFFGVSCEGSYGLTQTDGRGEARVFGAMPHGSQFENLCFSLFSIRFGVDLGVGPPQDLVPQQEGGTLGLTHSCFVLDDGGGWTLNRPLPESNGWNASSCFPTPGR